MLDVFEAACNVDDEKLFLLTIWQNLAEFLQELEGRGDEILIRAVNASATLNQNEFPPLLDPETY